MSGRHASGVERSMTKSRSRSLHHSRKNARNVGLRLCALRGAVNARFAAGLLADKGDGK